MDLDDLHTAPMPSKKQKDVQFHNSQELDKSNKKQITEQLINKYERLMELLEHQIMLGNRYADKIYLEVLNDQSKIVDMHDESDILKIRNIAKRENVDNDQMLLLNQYNQYIELPTQEIRAALLNNNQLVGLIDSAKPIKDAPPACKNIFTLKRLDREMMESKFLINSFKEQYVGKFCMQQYLAKLQH